VTAESVWDYPRPPRVEPSTRRVRIEISGATIVDTSAAQRVLETSHPPVYYVPAESIAEGALRSNDRRTFCEFKGVAHYFDVVVGDRVERAAAWSYPDPSPGFETIRDHVAFYPGRMDACHLDDELVQAQAGGFYGGWITEDVIGPFKGAPGTTGW
jgi:uncharacterized protein (DUF427 family)